MTHTTSAQHADTPANHDDNRACPSCSRPGVVRPDLTIAPHNVHGLASPCDALPSLIPDDYNATVLSAQWTAVPNNEIGGWAVIADGRSPLDGGVMAADLMWSQQVAEHVADLHNRTLDGGDPDVYADNVRLRADLDTMREVARGNKRHAAVLAEVLERVEKYADRLANYCSPHGVASRYANELRAEMSKPTTIERGTPPGGDVDWAVRVTMHNGASSIRHGDDPFTDRSSAEQAAGHARLGGAVKSAEVVCRQVWHGPWTAAPDPADATSQRETP